MLGAAPRVLLGWVSKVFMGPEGMTVAMRNGVALYFGDVTRPHAKWLAAARVLADPSSAGATYVDVRAPERPAAGTTAAGGLAGTRPPAERGPPTRRQPHSPTSSRKRSAAGRRRARHRSGGPSVELTEPVGHCERRQSYGGYRQRRKPRERTLTLDLRLRQSKSDSSGGG